MTHILASLCNLEPARFLIISQNVPHFIYFTHIPALILSILIAIFVLSHGWKQRLNRTLALTLLPFIYWVFANVMIWATNRSDLIMFLWAIQILLEPLVYVGMLSLVYTFINDEKEIPSRAQMLFFLIYLPLIFITPTTYSLLGFDLQNCIPIENFYSYYTYIIEISCVVAIIVLSIKSFRNTSSITRKKKIRSFAIGVILFLIAFASGNIFGSATEDWVTSQVGLLGMPIFAMLLANHVVKYRTFNIKIFQTQMLVVVLGFMTASTLLIRNINNIRLVIAGSLVLLVFVGRSLIRSVKKEIDQREKLEVLTTELAIANEKLKSLDKLKTEFLSLASHQLRSPLTAIKGYTSMLLEGDYGSLAGNTREIIDRVFQSTQHLTKVVEDLLNVSKIEQGGMKYEMAPFDVAKVCKEIATNQAIVAQGKGLKVEFVCDEKDTYKVNGDEEKLRQVFINLIDNSIKYTKEGSVTVSVTKPHAKSILIAIRDTGMGMTPEIKAQLFQKFSRGDGGKVNTGGSGLGLYLAKQIVEAHKGRIWIDSAGKDLGSTFSVELSEYTG